MPRRVIISLSVPAIIQDHLTQWKGRAVMFSADW